DPAALAEEGKIEPVIGRDNEFRTSFVFSAEGRIHFLLVVSPKLTFPRTKNNSVLIGEPGVGKTSIAEGLAQRIVNRDVPASLIGRLFSLDMDASMAGAKYKGEYEERIKSLWNEVEKSSEDGTSVILFVDELHLVMAGLGNDMGLVVQPIQKE
ncbi:P-loop containing nucleoside triphosphate hydrolase protein, partial [Suillus lakei]